MRKLVIMRKRLKERVILVAVLAVALLGSAIGSFAAAHGSAVAATPHYTTSFKSVPHVPVSHVHYVDAARIPQQTAAELRAVPHAQPTLYPGGQAALQALKSSSRAAAAPHNAGSPAVGSGAITPDYPSAFNKFTALVDSSATCPPGGCFPPDPAVAASPAGLALEVVNTSLDLYNNNGVQQSGWPKSLASFLGVPAPTPVGCAPNGPFLTNPRAWFDAYDDRFAVVAEEIEGSFGIDPACGNTSGYWFAASTTDNPSGTWRVLSLPTNTGSDGDGVGDFPQFGFNAQGIFVSGNVFDRATGNFDYASIVGCPKQAFYSGSVVNCDGGAGFTVGGVVVDTMEPVESLSTDFSPHAEYFVNTFDFNGDPSGDNCVSTACSGVEVWAWSDLDTMNAVDMTGVFVNTSHTYLQPPGADQPVCKSGADCLASDDTGINSTPSYHAGHIFAVHETGVVNSSGQFVTGIQWFDLVPTLAPGYPTTITGLTEYQDGLLNGSNNFISTINPVIMPDLDNDLMLGYVYTGDTIFPSINFTSRRVSDPLNTIPGGLGIVEVKGTASSADSAWGAYSSMSYAAPYQDFIWLAAAYAPTGNDWATELIKLRFNLNG